MPTQTSSRPARDEAHGIDVGRLTPGRFAELATWSRGPCVTITAPIAEGGRRAARILVKDLARTARNELTERATSPDLMAELLGPAQAFQQVLFAEESMGGVAVLSAPGESVTVAMGTTAPELAVVGERFVITPLLAEVAPTAVYHLLALSEHDPRLFRGSAGRLEPVRVMDMPLRIEDLFGLNQLERRRRGHGGGADGGAGRSVGATHSGGSDRDAHDNRLRRYFRAIDDAVAKAILTPRAQLLVAGIEYELSIYRDASRFERLETIDVGNADRLSASALRARCASTIDDVLDRPRRARLRGVLGAGTTLTSLPEIVDACVDGRVDTLFVRPDRLVWADPRSGGRSAAAERHDGDIEWHSETIGAALVHGTSVFAARPGELPDDVSAVASVRF